VGSGIDGNRIPFNSIGSLGRCGGTREMRQDQAGQHERLLVPLKSGDIPLLVRDFLAVMQE